MSGLLSRGRGIETGRPVRRAAGNQVDMYTRTQVNTHASQDLTCLRVSPIIVARVLAIVLVNHGAGETCQVCSRADAESKQGDLSGARRETK